jgi:hypothetical protein
VSFKNKEARRNPTLHIWKARVEPAIAVLWLNLRTAATNLLSSSNKQVLELSHNLHRKTDAFIWHSSLIQYIKETRSDLRMTEADVKTFQRLVKEIFRRLYKSRDKLPNGMVLYN